MTFQTFPKDENNREKNRAQDLKSILRSIWLPVVDEVITIIKQDLAGLIA
jgi:hypothetical protein